MGPDADLHAPGSFGHHRSLDGLRGIAVLAVVLYHFAPRQFPGGFLGVDVFFVLSGFLITSLLLVEFGTNSGFSLKGFWSRRARRLLPAAVACIIVAVALSWWLEPASSRSAVRTQSLASLFYVNNWSAIASGSSYEGQFGHDTPLAHFWSLAVEEQFYILFPVIVVALILILRRRRITGAQVLARPLLVLSTVGAVVSVSLMAILHVADTDPSRVYFGSDTRVHALLIGVGLACLNLLIPRAASIKPTRIATLAGGGALLALTAAFVIVDFHQNWLYEGGLVVIAVLTALIIWLAVRHERHPVTRVLRHQWLVQLGLVSYGLYLWHWPVRVFLTTAHTGLTGFALFGARVLVTTAATLISLVVIERPFRRASTQSQQRVSLSRRQFSLAVASLTGAAAICFMLTVPLNIEGASSRSAPPPVEVAGGGPARVLLIGDSVAWTLGGGELAFPAPETYVSPFPADRITLWNQARFGLSLQRFPKRRNGVVNEDCPTCEPLNDWRSAIEQFNPDLVVFSAVLWDTYDVRINGTWLSFGSPDFNAGYLAQLESLRAQITSTGSRLVIMIQPRPGNYPADWSREYADDSRTFPQLAALQRQFAADHPDVSIIDVDAELCPNDTCRSVDAEGKVLRADGIHFTTEGTSALSGYLASAFESLRSSEPASAANQEPRSG
jgi:peptidoglycan/LPS O-acetylase OafA/YrhL